MVCGAGLVICVLSARWWWWSDPRARAHDSCGASGGWLEIGERVGGVLEDVGAEGVRLRFGLHAVVEEGLRVEVGLDLMLGHSEFGEDVEGPGAVGGVVGLGGGEVPPDGAVHARAEGGASGVRGLAGEEPPQGVEGAEFLLGPDLDGLGGALVEEGARARGRGSEVECWCVEALIGGDNGPDGLIWRAGGDERFGRRGLGSGLAASPGEEREGAGPPAARFVDEVGRGSWDGVIGHCAGGERVQAGVPGVQGGLTGGLL